MRAIRPTPIPGDDAWSASRVTKTMWPPQPGTVALRYHYGAALVCVRYRVDASGRYRYTTIEVVVDHAKRRPRRTAPIRPAVGAAAEAVAAGLVTPTAQNR